MMRNVRLVLAAALFLVAVPLLQAASVNPIWEYASAGSLTDSRPFTLGFEFTTTTTFQINALGYWDDGASHQVGLWDTSGNLLTSTTVLGTDPVTGHFAYHPDSYTLAPGTYVIGGTYTGGPFPSFATGVTSLAGYTWVTDEQAFGTGLIFPNVSTGGGYGSNGIPIVDFSVGSSSAPEPGSLLLLGSGVLGLAGVIRRKINL